MSFLFCKLFLRLLYHPKKVIFFAMITTVALGLGITRLNTNSNLLDLFNKDSKARKEAKSFQKTFGGQSELVLVSINSDTLANQAFIDSFSAEIEKLPELFFIENPLDFQFIEQNKWLYASVEDLRYFRDNLAHQIQKRTLSSNPLIEILDPDAVQSKPQFDLEQLAEKYGDLFLSIPKTPSNWKILRIFPYLEGTKLAENRPFITKVQKMAQEMAPPGTELQYTGSLIKGVEQQEILTKEITRSALISGGLILLILLVFFMRQPLIPIIAGVPLFMSIAWTAGFMGWSLGYTNLLCITLSFILIGVGSDSVIHLLSRYGEERRKGLGPVLSLENIILETGPAITTANLSSATAFFCLALFPFDGFKDFGLVAGTGLIFTWINSMLVFPALLILIQSKKNFKVFGKKIRNHIQFKPRQNQTWKFLLFPVLAFLAYVLPSAPAFEEQLNNLSLPPNQTDIALMEIDQYRPNPIFYQTDNSITSGIAVRTLNKVNRQHENPMFKMIMTGSNLIPPDQGKKLDLIAEIKGHLTKVDVNKFPSEIISGIENFKNLRNSAITLSDLPASLQRIFAKTSTEIPGLVIGLPKVKRDWSLKDAQRLIVAAPSLIIEGQKYYPTGIPLLIAEYLNSTIPYVNQVFMITLLLVFLLIALDMKSWQYILLALMPVAISFPVTLWIMGALSSPINPFNLFLIPFLIGYSVDGSLHLVNRYKEEGMGSLNFVYRRTGSAVLLATLTSSMGFIGLALSDHPTLRSFGLLPLLALGVSLIASHLILPIALSIIDATRWSKYKQEES